MPKELITQGRCPVCEKPVSVIYRVSSDGAVKSIHANYPVHDDCEIAFQAMCQIKGGSVDLRRI